MWVWVLVWGLMGAGENGNVYSCFGKSGWKGGARIGWVAEGPWSVLKVAVYCLSNGMERL